MTDKEYMKMLIGKTIMENHCGLKNSVRRSVLWKEVMGFMNENVLERIQSHSKEFKGYADVMFRSYVKELIMEGSAIGTSARYGYYWITNEEDLLEALKELETKAKSISIRKNKLKETVEHQLGRQIQLPLWSV
jgi:hypothetical protein